MCQIVRYTISCTIPIDNPTQDKQLTDTKTITVYWDLSYGPVYVCKSNIADPASEHLCKKLYGMGRTCTAYPEYPESHFNTPKKVKDCNLKFVYINDTVCTGLQAQCNATGVTHNSYPPGVGLEFSVSGIPTYIMIHCIASGYDCMHGTYREDYLLWDINGNPLLDITRDVLDTDELKWHFTHDNKWIIMWYSPEFQPVIINIDELITTQKEINYEYPRRIDRMDWAYTVSPFAVSNMYYNDNVLDVYLGNHNIKDNRSAEVTDYKTIGIIHEFDEDVIMSHPLTYCKSLKIDLTTRKICKTEYYN